MSTPFGSKKAAHLLMCTYLALTAMGCCIPWPEDDEPENDPDMSANGPDASMSSGCRDAVCVVGSSLCDEDGNIRTCVRIEGTERTCLGPDDREVGTYSAALKECDGERMCYFGECVSAEEALQGSVLPEPYDLQQGERSLGDEAVATFAPDGQDILVIPESAFLAAYHGRSFSAASAERRREALSVNAQANDPVTLGVRVEVEDTNSFDGDLFMVLRHANTVAPTDTPGAAVDVAIESSNYYMVVGKLSGVSPWVGTSPEFLQGYKGASQIYTERLGRGGSATPSRSTCCPSPSPRLERCKADGDDPGCGLPGPGGTAPLGVNDPDLCGFGSAMGGIDWVEAGEALDPDDARALDGAGGFSRVAIHALQDSSNFARRAGDEPASELLVGVFGGEDVLPKPDDVDGGATCEAYSCDPEALCPGPDDPGYSGGECNQGFDSATGVGLGTFVGTGVEPSPEFMCLSAPTCGREVDLVCQQISTANPHASRCENACLDCFETYDNVCGGGVLLGANMIGTTLQGNGCINKTPDWCEHARVDGQNFANLCAPPDAQNDERCASKTFRMTNRSACPTYEQDQLEAMMTRAAVCSIPGAPARADQCLTDGWKQCSSDGGNAGAGVCVICTGNGECTVAPNDEYNAVGSADEFNPNTAYEELTQPEPTQAARVADFGLEGTYDVLDKIMASDFTRSDAALTTAEDIEVMTGTFTLSELDLSFPGPARSMKFERHYSSSDESRSILGSNWTHNWDKRVYVIKQASFKDNEVPPAWIDPYCLQWFPFATCAVFEDQGFRRIFYYDPHTRLFLPQAGSMDTLRMLSDGPDAGYEVRRPDGSILRFNSEGLVVEDRDRHGNGFTIEYEPTPTKRLFDAFCVVEDVETNEIGITTTSSDGQLCSLLGHMLGYRYRSLISPEFGFNAVYVPVNMEYSPTSSLTWPALPPAPARGFDPDDPSSSDPVAAAQDWRALRAAFEWGVRTLGDDALPLAPTGQLRLRPVRVVDDSARALVFTYEQDPEDRDYGLLREMTGPAGTRVSFTYDAPAEYPKRLQERFLVKVEREDRGVDDPRTIATRPRTREYMYQWPEHHESGAGNWELYRDALERERRAASFAATSCTNKGGDVEGQCNASIPTLSEARGNACAQGTFDAHDYVSSIADNIIMVTRNSEVVEVENRYGTDPSSWDHDRVLAQRFGGAAARGPGPGVLPEDPGAALLPWATTLPRHTIEYIDATAHKVRAVTSDPCLIDVDCAEGELCNTTTNQCYRVWDSDLDPNAQLPAALKSMYPIEPVLRWPRVSLKTCVRADQDPCQGVDGECTYEGLECDVVYGRFVQKCTRDSDCGPDALGCHAPTGMCEYAGPSSSWSDVACVSDDECCEGGDCDASCTNNICTPKLEDIEQPECIEPGEVDAYRVVNHAEFVNSSGASGANDVGIRRCDTDLQDRLQLAGSTKRRGYDYYRTTLERTPGPLSKFASYPKIKRSFLNCETIARRQLADARHNGLLHLSRSGEEAVASWETIEGIRGELETNQNRVCAWRVITDREGRRTYLGLNYTGRALVTARFDGADYIIDEAIYNADGLVIQQRYPTTNRSWEPVMGAELFVYEDPSLMGGQNWSLPFAWSRRGNLEAHIITPRPTIGLIPDHHSWDGSSPQVQPDPNTWATYTSYEYEPLFNQPRVVVSGTMNEAGDLNPHAAVLNDFDYQELSPALALEYLEARYPRWNNTGYPSEQITNTAPTGALERKLSLGLSAQARDLNGASPVSTSSPRRPTGVIVRQSLVDLDECSLDIDALRVDPLGCQSTRQIFLSYSPHARVKTFAHSGGARVEYGYYDALAEAQDDVFGPKEPDALATIDGGARGDGFLARRSLKRFGQADDELDYLGAPGCPQLSKGPFRYLLETCPMGARAALIDAGLSAVVVDQLLEVADATQSADASDPGLWSHVRYSYAETGHHDTVLEDDRVHLYTSDTDGRVLESRDPRGTRSSYTRAREGWVTRHDIHDAGGLLLANTRYVYDTNGRVLARCEALNQDGVEQPCDPDAAMGSAVVDPDLRVMTSTYNATGQPLTSSSPMGVVTTHTYDGFGRLARRESLEPTTQNKRRQAFDWDVWGNLEAVTHGVGVEARDETYLYDGFNRVVVHRDVRGVHEAFAYDRRGRLIAEKRGQSALGYADRSPAPQEQLIAYGPHDEVKAHVFGGEVRTEFTRDGLGQVHMTTQTGRAEPAFAFHDLTGQVVLTRDHDGVITVRALDHQDRRVAEATLHPPHTAAAAWTPEVLGVSTLIELDAMMEPVESTKFGARGEQLHTSNTLDGRGRLLRRTVHVARGDEPLVEESTAYNLIGWPILEVKSEDGAGGVETARRRYNARGDVVELIDPSGQVSQFVYDGFGSLSSKTMPGQTTPRDQFEYDSLGRVTMHSMARDADGGRDRLDHVYDGQWYLRRVERAGQTLTEFTWDELGRLEASVDYNPGLNALGYDAVVRRGYSWDHIGRVAQDVMEITSGADVKSYNIASVWALDQDNWMRQITLPSDARRTYFFDSSDKLTRVERRDSGGRAGPLDARIHWLGKFYTGHELDHLTDAEPFVERVSLDGFGRPRMIEHEALQATAPPNPSTWADSYCPSPLTRAECARPLLSTRLVRDPLGRILSTSERFAWPDPESSSMQGSRQWRGYEYNRHGRLTAEFEHDALGASGPEVDVSGYVYGVSRPSQTSVVASQHDMNNAADPVTHWAFERETEVNALLAIRDVADGSARWALGQNRSLGHLLEEVQIDQTDYPIQHDRYGRVTGALEREHVFDERGRLIAVLDPSTGAPVELYAYAHDNILARVIKPDHASAGAEALEDHVRDGALLLEIARYTRAPGMAPERISTSTMTWGPGMDRLFEVYTTYDTPAAGEASWRVDIPAVDHRNTTRAVLSHTNIADTRLAARFDYDAHGRLVVLDIGAALGACEEPGSTNTCDQLSTVPFMFQGQWRSASSMGLVYMRQRWYDPSLAQFISPDPLDHVDAYNLYAFAGYDPINMWDPLGMKKRKVNNDDDQREPFDPLGIVKDAVDAYYILDNDSLSGPEQGRELLKILIDNVDLVVPDEISKGLLDVDGFFSPARTEEQLNEQTQMGRPAAPATDASVVDTDGDGVPDSQDGDADGDGAYDGPKTPGGAESDGDGSSSGTESDDTSDDEAYEILGKPGEGRYAFQKRLNKLTPEERQAELDAARRAREEDDPQ